SGVYAYVTTKNQPLPVPPPPVSVLAPTPPPVMVAPPPPPPRSTLVVHAPAGARVDVDGQAGVSSGAPLKLDVAGGEHRVVVTATRRQPFDERVTVAAGATAEVSAKLQRLQKGAPKGADTVPSTVPPAAAPATVAVQPEV